MLATSTTAPTCQEREFFRTVSHPVAEEAKYPGMGPRLSGMDYEVRRHAPLLGQHNREIYGEELGCSDSELTQLRALGAI